MRKKFNHFSSRKQILKSSKKSYSSNFNPINFDPVDSKSVGGGGEGETEERAAFATCGLISIIVYLNTLSAGFVYDDTRVILQNPDVTQIDTLLTDVNDFKRWHPGSMGLSQPLIGNSSIIKHVHRIFSNDYWGNPLKHVGSHKSYRPLTTLSFVLDNIVSHRLFGSPLNNPKPVVFHFTSIVLHCSVTLLFMYYMRTCAKFDLRSSFIAALIFAVHPVHCEAVAGIAGRADVLCCFFFLLTLIVYNRGNDNDGCHDSYESQPFLTRSGCRWKGSDSDCQFSVGFWSKIVILSMCCMLAKEQGLTVLAICCVHQFVSYRRNVNIPNVLLAGNGNIRKIMIILASLLSLRLYIMDFKTPSFAKADNPTAVADSWTQLLTFSYLPAFSFFNFLVFPTQLSFDWSMDSITLIQTMWDFRNLVTILFLVGLITSCYKSLTNPMDHVLISLSLLTIPMIPASNLLFYVGFVVAERLLYIPSLGFCMLLAIIFNQLQKASMHERLIKTLVVTLTLALAARTFIRNRDWQDEYSLYKSGIAVNPAKAYANLGNVFSEKGLHREAEDAFKQALSHRPNMADVHYNLGVLYQNQDKKVNAMKCYEAAIFYRYNFAVAHLNLALIQRGQGETQKAINILKLIPDLPGEKLKHLRYHRRVQFSSIVHLVRIYMDLWRGGDSDTIQELMMKQMKKAENMILDDIGTTLETMLDGVNVVHALYTMKGEVYEMIGEFRNAEMWYRKALYESPSSIGGYLKYGKMLARNKSRQNEAVELLVKATDLAPSDSNVHFQVGLFLLESFNNKHVEAAKHFQLASSTEHLRYESIFNAAVAFRQAGMLDEAQMYYMKAVNLKPKDASAHMNLGALLHLRGRYDEAKSFYLEALKLNPGDENTRINLARVEDIMKRNATKH